MGHTITFHYSSQGCPQKSVSLLQSPGRTFKVTSRQSQSRPLFFFIPSLRSHICFSISSVSAWPPVDWTWVLGYLSGGRDRGRPPTVDSIKDWSGCGGWGSAPAYRSTPAPGAWRTIIHRRTWARCWAHRQGCGGRLQVPTLSARARQGFRGGQIKEVH